MQRLVGLRWPAVVVVLASSALVMVIVLAGAMVTRPWPRTDGVNRLAGLDEAVTVYRDRWGIPHVYAATTHDLFFAQGYVHAQDRFGQMELWRRLGAGRLSELYGEDTLDQDRLARILGWRRIAEEEYHLLDGDTRAALDAYAEGVNAYLSSQSGRLGLEFTLLRLAGVRFEPEPWVPADTLTWGKVMAWELGNGARADVLRAALVDRVGVTRAQELLPPYSDERPVIVPGDHLQGDAAWWIDTGTALSEATLASLPWEALDRLDQALGVGPGLGSNSWALSAERTDTGRPLLANDPHLRAHMPSVWYEIGLHCEPVGLACPYRVVGASFAGMPGVMIGHNERIAWGMTNTNPDVNDLYVEHANPMNPDEYRVGDTWVPMDVRYEVVRVHGWDEPLALRVRSTRHGPIINDPAAGDDWAFGWQPLAMRWTGNAPGMMVQAVLAMNRAGNWEAFRAALRGFDVPSQNVVYADVEGNIGYQMTGRIPIRARGLGALPVPGWTDEYAWVGTIAYDDLPRALNPTDGAIVTANNRVTDAGYPYHLGSDWNRGLRAARIAQMLSARNAVSIADCCAVQDDALVTYAHGILRNLEAVIPKDRRAAEAVEILRRWDRRADADAVAPAVFAVWHMHLVREVFGDELGDDVLDRYLFNASVPVLDALDNALNGEGAAWCDDVRTPGMERCAQIVARAFDRAVDELTDRLGPSVRAWRWGRLHQVTFIHPTMGRAGVGLLEVVANRGPMAVGGTCDTVKNVCFDPRRPYTAELLPTYRQIIDVGAWENSVAVNSTGQSGHPFHRHYTDMIRLWREGTYHPMLWHRDDIAREASAVLVIEPVEAVGGRDGGPSAGSR